MVTATLPRYTRESPRRPAWRLPGRFLRTFFIAMGVVVVLCFIFLRPDTGPKTGVRPGVELGRVDLGSAETGHPVNGHPVNGDTVDGTSVFGTTEGPSAASSSADIPSSPMMPKMENATAKAELGRGTWRLLHTMAGRFPDTPTADELEALRSFIFMLARVYPCGDCAAHFQALLAKYPPQTSSRKAASGHLCFLHNQVNVRLGKPEFDCSQLDAMYDCGCGDDEKGRSGAESTGTSEPGGSRMVDPDTGYELVEG